MKYVDFLFKYSSILPELSNSEYQELKTDIAEKGVLVPILVDENSEIIDGQHRLKIAKELGFDVNHLPFNVKIDLSEQEKYDLALDLNLHRRHLTREQRQELVIKLRQDGMSQRAIADRLNVSQPTIKRDLDQGDTYVSPDTITGKDGKKYPATKPINATAKNLVKIKKVVDASQEKGQEYLKDELAKSGNIKRGYKERNRLNKEKARQENAIELSTNKNVWHGDFRTLGQEIPDNSVDLIFTDPPYNKEAIELYYDLGIFAARVLKPGGLCLTYSGQIHLPQVLNALSENLEYIWCFAVRHNSGYTKIFKINGRNMWKPILLFAKLPYQMWWKTIDDMIDGKMEKSDHEWQQGLNEATYYLSMLCPQNSLVVDPFCGSGTTLLAAKNLKLNYIGIEDDIEDVKKTIKRLNDN